MKAAQRLMLRHNIEAVETNSKLTIRFEQVGLIRQRHPAHIKMLSGILGAHFFFHHSHTFAFNNLSEPYNLNGLFSCVKKILKNEQYGEV
mgnify:CR=1 FL=1